MSTRKNKLEDFIKQHRDAFDDHTPSNALWQRIERNLDREKKKPVSIISMKKGLQVAAAAIIIIAASVVFYLVSRPEGKNAAPVIANADTPDTKSQAADTNNNLAYTPVEADTPAGNPAQADNDKKKKNNPPVKIDEEELYHYSRLIEIKQGQMAELKQNEPELYKEFSADMELLETSYLSLKQQFKQGLNSEKLLEAMIQNLKMQTDLLNKQLEILKQIHHKKQKDNENYKSL